jgi:UDP-N-acetylmuramoyl-tripeptide--D-alanyl-D-alanine ligase
MTALWTSDEAAAATGGVNTAPWAATGVSIDSRSLDNGDLFIAIKGPNSDGHDHIAKALASGAAASVSAREEAAESGPALIVADTLTGMQALARHARQRGEAKIVAVTGSTGKTGTKDTLELALGRQAETHATEGNLNNHWGLPLSLSRMPRSARFGVLEMGMNSAGEIAPLSHLTQPDVAIVTNVSAVHIEFFQSEEDIADAKAEIFAGMNADGVAILNRDNRHFDRLRGHAENAGIGQIRSFGAHRDANTRLVKSTPNETGSRVTAEIDGVPISYTLGAPGAHWVINSLGALAVIDALGADVSKAARTMSEIAPAVGRGAQSRIQTKDGAFLLIDESYNASPASTRAALDVLGACKGRRIAVLGDMLELGERTAELHRSLASHITDNHVDLVFLAGAGMAALAAALDTDRVAATGGSSDAILPQVIDAVRPGDSIMVKGSLGSRMAPIVSALKALELPSDSAATRRAANDR